MLLVKMKKSIKAGFSFGLTSGAITTMGLMVGLYTGTHSLKIVVGGILTIAIADAFSDSLGIHIHEESENDHTTREIWESTIATFVSKFIFSLTFLIPLFLFSLKFAIIINVIWGLNMVAFLSHQIAKEQGVNSKKVVLEHIIISITVIILTYFAGSYLNSFIY